MAASPLDLLVVGHINIDAEIRVKELPAGDRTVPVVARTASLGGTAANIARWSSLLGLKVALSSFVGPDLPPAFQARLRKDGVGLRDVVERKGELTPTCWIFEDGKGGQMTIIDQGAMRDTSRERVPRRSLERTRWVHATTGDPPYQIHVAETARTLGRSVACDPAQEVHYRWSRRELGRMLELSEILFGNEMEIAAARSLMKAPSTAGLLAHVPLVVVTRGERGARAHSRRGTVEVPAVRIRNFHRVTGAGDAFRAGFYRGWFDGEPLERCLRWGTAAGATAVEFPHGPAGELPPARLVSQRMGQRSPRRPRP